MTVTLSGFFRLRPVRSGRPIQIYLYRALGTAVFQPGSLSRKEFAR